MLSQLSYAPKYMFAGFLKNSATTLGQWVYLDSNQGPQLYQSCTLAN